MIKVIPIQDKQEQERYCKECGVPYSPDLLAYYALDEKERFAGICQFKNDQTGGHIYHLTAPLGKEDIDPLFVMGRATLNFMDLCGVKTAYFEGEPCDDALLRRIGFAPDAEGRYAVSLEGFFTKPCCHHPQ